MMQQKINRIIGCVLFGMLCCIGEINAMPQASQPAAWRTTPTMSNQTRPAYQFRSTSNCAPVVGSTSYTSATVYTPGASSPSSNAPYRAKKGDFDEPGDDDTGIGNVPTPVGEPLILLLFALGYIAFRRLSPLHPSAVPS